MSRLRQPLSYSAVSSVLSTVSFAGGRVGAECIQDDLSKLPTAADCWPTAGQLLPTAGPSHIMGFLAAALWGRDSSQMVTTGARLVVFGHNWHK